MCVICGTPVGVLPRPMYQTHRSDALVEAPFEYPRTCADVQECLRLSTANSVRTCADIPLHTKHQLARLARSFILTLTPLHCNVHKTLPRVGGAALGEKAWKWVPRSCFKRQSTMPSQQRSGVKKKKGWQRVGEGFDIGRSHLLQEVVQGGQEAVRDAFQHNLADKVHVRPPGRRAFAGLSPPPRTLSPSLHALFFLL